MARERFAENWAGSGYAENSQRGHGKRCRESRADFQIFWRLSARISRPGRRKEQSYPPALSDPSDEDVGGALAVRPRRMLLFRRRGEPGRDGREGRIDERRTA